MTFLCKNNCGISTCGSATLVDSTTKTVRNITWLIYDYIDNNVTKKTSVFDTANNLLTYINKIDSKNEVRFIVAGYNNGLPEIYYVITGKHSGVSSNLYQQSSCGAKWDGEINVLTKILKPTYLNENPIEANQLTINSNNQTQNLGDCLIFEKSKTTLLPMNNVLWNLLSLHDAIDFVRYAISITVDTMRFSNVNKTVGGPIDILVIKPNKSIWIAHKKLH